MNNYKLLKMITIRYLTITIFIVFVTGITPTLDAQEAQLDRTELPIKAYWYSPITDHDAKAPTIFEVSVPQIVEITNV
jgi:arylsulfatase